MCGICGYVGPTDPAILERMRDSLRHRGPDEAGKFFGRDVCLGHRRLSILDLSTGQQPLYSEDGNLVLVFNGARSTTSSSCVTALRPTAGSFAPPPIPKQSSPLTTGMEPNASNISTACSASCSTMRSDACCLAPATASARSPLYYTQQPLGSAANRVEFAFASELKSLLEHPVLAQSFSLSHSGLISYLLNDYVLGEQRIYDEVRCLPAGSAFVFGLEDSASPGFRLWKYWDISLAPSAVSAASIDEREACHTVVKLLEEAVAKRLVADVPVGALLSGGIDSSAVVAMMTRLKPPSEVKTFSIGFDDPSFDESAHAQSIARRFGTTHRTRQFTAAELLQRLPVVAAMLDEPFADPSILPVSLLCEFAREYVTVALGGDGGDELFAGYDPFRAVGPAAWYRRLIPGPVHRYPGHVRWQAACRPATPTCRYSSRFLASCGACQCRERCRLLPGWERFR